MAVTEYETPAVVFRHVCVGGGTTVKFLAP